MRPKLFVLAFVVISFSIAAFGQTSKTSTSAEATATKVDPDGISGRILDATSHRPVKGTVVVALENQTGDGKIINETSPDAIGHFAFAKVPAGSYALVIAGQTAKKVAYTPVILVSASQ